MSKEDQDSKDNDDFKSARRVEPSDLISSLPGKLSEMAIPIGLVGIGIGLICLLNENNNSLVTAGAIVFGSGLIADAIRSHSKS